MPAEFYDEDGFRLSFENDTSSDERQYFMRAFPNVSKIAERRIHCSTCNSHIGTAPVSEAVIRMHPVLRVTHCRNCHAFYNSGDFDKGEDGSELYCRWCGQGGEVFCCSKCPYVFCKSCIVRNLSRACVQDIVRNENWHCFSCAPRIMWHLRAQHWALENFIEKQKKEIKQQELSATTISALMKQDRTSCCPGKGVNRHKGNGATPTSTSPANVPKKSATKRSHSEVGSGSKLEPVVSIPPLAHSILGEMDINPGVIVPLAKATPKTSSSASTGSPPPPSSSGTTTVPSSSGKVSVPKKKQKTTSSDESGQQAARPPQAKKKRIGGNNEVVCTPDILSMLSDEVPQGGQTPPTRPPIVTVGTKPPVPIAPKPRLSGDQASLNQGSPMVLPETTSPGLVPKINVPKQKAILHHSIPRNLAVSVPANRVAAPLGELGAQPIRVSSAVARPSASGQPLYHTFEGYQIDLQAASQQSTYRLPNGKLILVRKQTSDANAQAAGVAGEQQQQPQAVGITPVQPANVVPISSSIPANRVLHNNAQVSPGQVIIRNGQEVRRLPPMNVQRQQTLQQNQRAQMQLQQVAQQKAQYQQQFQRLHSRPDQRTPNQRSIAQRMPQSQQQQLHLQQQQQHMQQPPQPGMYTVPVGPGGIVYSASAAPNLPAHATTQGAAPLIPASNSAQQPQILNVLRSMVNGPHEDTPLGSARKDFEAKMLAGAEICHHIIGKIYSLTNSNSFKNIRNLRDLKELFIHLSYLMTYGIGRFKTLHERCVDDVKKMGFTKESDFVMMGERINNRNPEDDNSEDDDDCEIIEQNTTVIEVDSDDEATAAGKEKNKTSSAAKKSAPAAKKQSDTEKDGPAKTLTVGEIVVTWKVADVGAKPPAQSDKGVEPPAATTAIAVSGEVVVSPEKTMPAVTGGGSNQDDSSLMSEKDKFVEGTAEAMDASVTKNLLTSTEMGVGMETDANNSVTDGNQEPATTATQTPENGPFGNAIIDSGTADKDEVELIEISDKEVSELLDCIHADTSVEPEKDNQSVQKDESIDVTDPDDVGQNGSTQKEADKDDTTENAKTGTAGDKNDTALGDKTDDAGLDASAQKAIGAPSADKVQVQKSTTSAGGLGPSKSNETSQLDDLKHSSKGSSSEVLNLMDAADDSYHSDSSDIQLSTGDAMVHAGKRLATKRASETGEPTSVKDSEPDVQQLAEEKTGSSLQTETEKDETVVSKNESNPSKPVGDNTTATIDLEASIADSADNTNASNEDMDASKKGDEETVQEENSSSSNKPDSSKNKEKQAASTVGPSAIIDLDASSTGSDKTASEDEIGASKKGGEESVQEKNTSASNKSDSSKKHEKQTGSTVGPSAIIDLDASAESDINKNASEENNDASKKGEDESVQEDRASTRCESDSTKENEKHPADVCLGAIIDLDACSAESDSNKNGSEKDNGAIKGEDEPAQEDKSSAKSDSDSTKEHEKLPAAAAGPTATIEPVPEADIHVSKNSDAASVQKENVSVTTESSTSKQHKTQPAAICLSAVFDLEDISDTEFDMANASILEENASVIKELVVDLVNEMQSSVKSQRADEKDSDKKKDETQEVQEGIGDANADKVNTTGASCELQSQEKEPLDESSEVVGNEATVKSAAIEVMVEDDDEVICLDTPAAVNSTEIVNNTSEPMDADDDVLLPSMDAEKMDVTEEEQNECIGGHGAGKISR
uniref:PHD-type domain-containing protein n=1 Tax=Anopheles christyi TaxID=43041 RepID=A0A182JYH8_9DIPT